MRLTNFQSRIPAHGHCFYLLSTMSSDWVETKAILSEVEQLFNRDDDIRYIYDVKKMAREIDDHCASYLSETKDIIKSKPTSFSINTLLSASRD